MLAIGFMGSTRTLVRVRFYKLNRLGFVTGLQIATVLHITHIMVEIDSTILINLIDTFFFIVKNVIDTDIDLHPLGTAIIWWQIVLPKRVSNRI